MSKYVKNSMNSKKALREHLLQNKRDNIKFIRLKPSTSMMNFKSKG